MSSSHFSRRGPLVVLEGMPGSGKTSTLNLLTAHGQQTIPEYLGSDQMAPSVADDDAHQLNWIRKSALSSRLRLSGTVYSDRDFVTALAYAYSIRDSARHLLGDRILWAREHVQAGRLVFGDVYVVLDVPVSVSISRRANRLCPEHPWSDPATLERLREFYLAPAAIMASVDMELGTKMSGAKWHFVSGLAAVSETLAVSEGAPTRCQL